MTFEEDFPELKDCTFMLSFSSAKEDVAFIKDIQKYCLSKKRVREVINKLDEFIYTREEESLTEEKRHMIWKRKLLKELGLEEEYEKKM